MIRIKSKLTDAHIIAIGSILAHGCEPPLITFFDLVGIEYVIGESKCRLLKCIDEGGTLEDIMEIAGNSFSAIIGGNKIARIRAAL